MVPLLAHRVVGLLDFRDRAALGGASRMGPLRTSHGEQKPPGHDVGVVTNGALRVLQAVRLQRLAAWECVVSGQDAQGMHFASRFVGKLHPSLVLVSVPLLVRTWLLRILIEGF